ncbi:MAG: flagellar biosynthesis anti-sigma factor FlgM [Oscillospiraceae bacterium]
MKINPSAGLDQYKKYVQTVKGEETAAAKAAENKGAAPANTDKVTLSEEAASRAGLGRVVSALSSDANDAVSPKRLAELGAQVADGSYHVASGDLADAILGLDTKA